MDVTKDEDSKKEAEVVENAEPEVDPKEKQRKELMVMSVDKLKKKCKDEKVSAEGNKIAMVDRLIAKMYSENESNETSEVVETVQEVQGDGDEKKEEEVENTVNDNDEQEAAVNNENEQSFVCML